jgi:hypothetical protein
MKRHVLLAVLLTGVVLVAGAALAQQGRGRMHRETEEATPGRMQMMGPGHMMGAGRMAGGGMMAGDLAAWNGSVYLLQAGQLHKLNAQLEVVRSVDLPFEKAEGMMPGRMMGGRHMMGGGMMQMGMGHMGMRQEYGPGPGELLRMQQMLDLTDEQVGRLEGIAQDAHEEAQAVLTDEQREKLDAMMPMQGGRPSGEEAARQGRREHPGAGMMEHPARGMMGGMEHPQERGRMGGMMGRRSQQEHPAMGPMGGMGPMQGMGMMAHMARVAADRNGAYVLVGGRVAVYNHGLEHQRTGGPFGGPAETE